MSGRHQFDELTKGFSKQRRERIEAVKAELLAELPLRGPPLQQEGRLAAE